MLDGSNNLQDHSFWALVRHMSRGAPLLIARKAATTVFGLATFALLARGLSKEQYAVYTLVFAFLPIVRLSALPGLGNAVMQGFARGRSGGFRRAQSLSLLCSLLGVAFLGAVAFWHFNGGKTQEGVAFSISAIFFPAVAGLLFWQNALLGWERYRWFLTFEVLAAFSKLIAVAATLYFFPVRLYLVIGATLLATGITNVLATVFLLRRMPPAEAETDAVRYGMRTTLFQFPTVLAAQFDKLLLFYFISPEALAVYAVALRVPELARSVIGDVNSTLGPFFARQTAYTAELRKFSIKFSLLAGLLSTTVILLLVPYVLPLLVGSQYPDAVLYAQIMMLGSAFAYFENLQFRFVKSQLDSSSFLRVTLFNSVVDLVTIGLLGFFFGMAGVVAAYVIKSVARSLFVDFIVNPTLWQKRFVGLARKNPGE